MTELNDIPEEILFEVMYLHGKAECYLKVGPEAWRTEGLFNQPPADCSSEMLATIQRGMEQICLFQGFSRDNAFDGLGVDGFYTLLSILGFGFERQFSCKLNKDELLDEMHMKHLVTGQSIVLYNKVPKPSLSWLRQQP